MDWTKTMSEPGVERRFLEADAARMLWELNYRLLMEGSLAGQVFQVEWIQVTGIRHPVPGEEKTQKSFLGRLWNRFTRMRDRIRACLKGSADHGGGL